MPLALLALAIGAFGIGTTEFVMMGVLPEAADGLAVSIPTAGDLITSYAVGVVIGAPTLSILGTRLPRRSMLIAMMGLFTVGNLLFALSPNAELGMVFRFLAGLPHGAFFGAGAVVAASLANEGSRARAVSMMFMGLTTANIAGVPLGTLLGQQLGWRSTFFVVAALGLLALVAITVFVPHQGRPVGQEASPRAQLGAFRIPQVWLALVIVTFGLGGTFACLSYLTPILTNVSGFSPTGVTGMLALVGLGMTCGNVIGGRLADKALMPGLYGALIAMGAVLVLFSAVSGNQIAAAITVFFIGLSGFMVAPLMQARVMRQAGGAPSLVSASVQSAFNIANSIGASLGGLAIANGFGPTSPALVGAGLAVLGLVLAIGAGTLERQSSPARAVATEQREPAYS